MTNRVPHRLHAALSRRVAALVFTALLAGASACGDDGPSGPAPVELEIIVLSGDAQVALAGGPLGDAFEARVERVGGGKPESGVTVTWTVVEGDGARVGPSASTTNEAGVATTRLTLGPALGEYRVEAVFDGLTGAPATFVATAILPPSVMALSGGPVAAGGAVVIEGTNFRPSPDENTVLFSGLRGRVTAATETELTALVPACVPGREVMVSVRVGSLESNAAALSVLDNGSTDEMALGQAIDVVDASGLVCHKLPGGQGQAYLAVVSASSQVAAARWGYTLSGLTGDETTGPPAFGSPPAGEPPTPYLSALPGPQAEWDRELRGLEKALLAEGVPSPPAAAAAQRASVPAVGERRDFDVLNKDQEFTRVTAEAVFVADRAVIYQDLNAPAGGLDARSFGALGRDFDDPIFPTNVDVFGETSDLDGNERVVILFTPVVNELTPRGADGFVGGFFFGLDLLVGRPGSNEGEVFYALVPDPEGEFGDERSTELVMDVIPAILAHEFQHMIGFGQRALVLGATSQEALWLSEALAQMAEDVVGDAFLERVDTSKAILYKSGNWIRGERYLRDPGDVSLIVAQGQGSLEERGGGWLFVRYLRGQSGSDQIFGDLTRTTRVGVANVVAVTGRSWESQFPDWSAALYLDETGVPAPQALLFPDLDLRSVIEVVEDPYPLMPRRVGNTDFVVEDDLWSSASDYFIIRPPVGGGTLSLSLSGPDGGDPTPASRLQLTLVRIE